MIWLITLNIITGFLCLGGLYWLYRRQERGVRSQEELLKSVKTIRGRVGTDLAQRISQNVFTGLSSQLRDPYGALSPPSAITMGSATPDIRLIPTPMEEFQNFGPLELDKPISTLGLSESLMRRLPGQVTEIIDLYSNSTASLVIRPGFAHELNTVLVAFAVRNFENLKGFQEIMEAPLSTYKLPYEVDGQILGTLGDAVRHEWKDTNAERHFALILRRTFSKFILDYSIPGFSEACARKVETFGLSTRLKNLFRSRGITTVEHLISCTVSDLKAIRNFGDAAVKEARNILESDHLRFGMLDLIKDTS